MEQIFKLQPNRCLALRGFDSFAAPAALHSATADGFQVSGTFRDQADFAVLQLWDADNFYEHPSIKHLPDFDFSGLVLNFNLQYSDGVQPIDSPKFNWIDWATLDCILVNDDPSRRPRIRLWDYATLHSGAFTPASGIFQLTTGEGGLKSGDRLTLWFENVSFDYVVPAIAPSVEYAFYAKGTGAIHTITINDRVYSHTESDPAGESSTAQAKALISAINASGGDPDVVAAAGGAPNNVLLTVRANAPDASIAITASENLPASLGTVSLGTVAAAFATSINATDWSATARGLAILAESSDENLHVSAARHGFVSTQGATVTWSPGVADSSGDLPWSEKFTGLAAGDTIRINQIPYPIGSVDSPTRLTLAVIPETDANLALYVAPRGGRDGNLFTLYSLAQPRSGQTTPNLNTQPFLHLAGGDSSVTWNISLDFTALGIDQLSQCWLTFAPSLTNGAPTTDTNWLATFSDWTLSGDDSKRLLKIAGAGSVRIEETSSWCTYSGAGWAAAPGETGFYSKYAAAVARNKISIPNSSDLIPVDNAVSIVYQCASAHDLYVGTSLYTDRGVVSVTIDNQSVPDLNCYLNSVTGAAVVTRRKLASSLSAGSHTVRLQLKPDDSPAPKLFYFDFLEAAVPSGWPGPRKMFKRISPALDYDTDHTYKLPPARLMWIFDQLGFAGPVNEYMGVFWWNQRSPSGAVFPQTTVTFDGKWVEHDALFLTFNADPDNNNPGDTLGKTVFPADTSETIAAHFALYLNAVSTGAWASASGNTVTIASRSPAPPYALTITSSVQLASGSTGTIAIGDPPAAGVYATWIVDPAKRPIINRPVSDWHTDFYSECAARGLEVTSAGSMELVLPPSGFSAIFPDGTPVTTDTGFGSLTSNHCAVGGLLLLDYQKHFYREVADLQAAAGLVPAVQFGEFLWWFFGLPINTPKGMAYYDEETKAAAQASLGRPLHTFLTPNDDPTVNGSADAIFLRNRLRDHVAAIASDLRQVHPDVRVEVLFPYDVNYPKPVVPGNQLGGRLNRFINLPVEWQQKQTSGLDRIKVEALQFTTQFRSMDLARQAVQLMTQFGWPSNSVRYLAPVFGSFVPWTTEVGLGFAQNLNAVNLWAFDHICLLNLDLTNLREPT